ncbi:MAG: tetratricopeptide repeat protein [Burkholderiales bacterium]|nr:tetratricopeptide repeat protein [Burkholderiales bacterium]
MSLLLEALKKAELAKQAAKEPRPAADKPPFTRDKLPDISQPMEIHSDDLGPAKRAPASGQTDKPAFELALEEPTRAAAPAPPPRAAPLETGFTATSEAVERKQAQQLFETNELDVNPRKPFYITMGALGLFALGTVGYFWYQLQPRTLFQAPPQAAALPAPTMAAAPAAESAAPAAITVAPPVGTQTTLPPPVPAAADAAPPAAPAAVPAGARRKAPRRRAAPAIAVTAAQPPVPTSGNAITITPAKVQADPVLQSAYQAFNSGDLARSRDDYRQVLRNRPDNRDALLGLAAVEIQAGHYDAAQSYYARLLELDPRDAYAHAGLIGLKGQVDPLAAESRLKSMIAAQPEASFLNFTLGNQYAAQGRWAEAQQAYFRAYSGDPEHPDFAYNLAVSLDKMHQTKPALEYYRLALTLAEGRPVTFDRAQVSKRVSQLAR